MDENVNYTKGTQYYNSSNSGVRKYNKKSNITLYAGWSACPAGKYAVAGATSCSTCSGNTYTNKPSQSVCTTCATGYTVNSTHTGCTPNVLSIEYNGNGGTWNNSSNGTYGVNSSGTVIVKSTNKVYSQQLNYGTSLESSGLVDYNGSWFNWKHANYEITKGKEYFIQNGSTKTEFDQAKVYSAVDLARYGGCDLSIQNCTITIKVNWKKSEWSINKDYGTGTWVYHKKNSEELKKYYSNAMPFAEYIPERAVSSGNSLPLIIFLHGYGYTRYQSDGTTCLPASCLLGSVHVNIIKKWNTTGLKNIPAIMMAPHLEEPDWGNSQSVNTIKAMISYAKDKYNINTNKVVLMGHSHGGYGVPRVFDKAKDKFSALVIMSGTEKNTLNRIDDLDALKRIPLKGYSENTSVGDKVKDFFNGIGRINDLTIYKNTSHNETAKKALIEDKNNDKVSDLIYWSLSQTRN